MKAGRRSWRLIEVPTLISLKFPNQDANLSFELSSCISEEDHLMGDGLTGVLRKFYGLDLGFN